METTKKKWVTLLLTATMSFALLFGATACNDNNDGNIIVEDDAPDVVVPDVVVPDTDSDVDVDVDVESEAPMESPAAS